MKITSDHIYADFKQAQGSNKTQGDESFGDMLAQMVAEKVPTSSECSQVAQAESVSSSEQTLSPLWFQASGLLDSLDAYSQALGNPGRTLKDLEPLVKSMELQAEELEVNLAEVKDPQLAQLGNEAVLAARVESLKYWRGDFIG
jgi:hypothetical protein